MADAVTPWFRMCEPCSEVRHDDCVGGEVFCECLAEVLMEAEDVMQAEREQRDASD